MKIFPAVHYSMGGLWVDYEKSAAGGLVIGSPRNQRTNIPNLYAIGECDYQYHGANRLGANSLLSCIFSGLFVAPGDRQRAQECQGSRGRATGLAVRVGRRHRSRSRHDQLLKRPAGGENPYLLHQELGDVMTKAATVVRHNDSAAAKRSAKVDRSGRTGQALLAVGHRQLDEPERGVHQGPARHVPAGQGDLMGAIARDECRGAHFKPDFAMPGLEATDPAEHRREAEAVVRPLRGQHGQVAQEHHRHLRRRTASRELSYEDVDTSLIPPRPRLYGLVGAEVIEEVWKARQAAKAATTDGNGNPAAKPTPQAGGRH